MWKILGLLGNLRKFLNKAIAELAVNGKLLLVWITNEFPGITEYPGLNDALQKFLSEPTQSNLWHLIFQAVWAGAAGHRALKILVKLLK